MAHEPPYDPATYTPSAGRHLPSKCGPKVGGLEVTPSVLFFHFIEVGEVSDYQPVTYTNKGQLNIGIAGHSISPEFEFANSVPLVLEPGQSVQRLVRFRPAALGARVGQLTTDIGEGIEDPCAVQLIGIGGTLTGGPVIGDPSEVQDIVNTFLGMRWAYRYGTFAVKDIMGNEIVMDYHVTAQHTLQPNFSGCAVSCETPPSSEFILTVLKNGVEIGQITINPDGTIEKLTTGGLAIGVPPNSIITVRAPAIMDEAIARLRMTFVGVVPL